MNLNGENDLSQNFSNFWGSHGTRKRERKYVGKIQREFLMRTLFPPLGRYQDFQIARFGYLHFLDLRRSSPVVVVWEIWLGKDPHLTLFYTLWFYEFTMHGTQSWNIVVILLLSISHALRKRLLMVDRHKQGKEMASSKPYQRVATVSNYSIF